MKVSYGCVDNIAQIVKKYNKVLTPENTSPQAACNCRDKPECPLDGACLTKSIVYQAEVKTGDGQTKQYIGMTERHLKQDTPCINNLLEIQNTSTLPPLCQNTSGN